QKATGIPPLMLLVPATLAASLGFMLPVATAPNTIVFGSGRINSAAMRNAGSLLDLAGVVIITLFSALIGSMIWK
ncbi:MAG: anion permease, partial [Chitinophagales bacterium]